MLSALDARLASVAALIGLIWDAINDPLVGMLSYKVQSRWGRRRPFLLVFSHSVRPNFFANVVGSSLGEPDSFSRLHDACACFT